MPLAVGLIERETRDGQWASFRAHRPLPLLTRDRHCGKGNGEFRWPIDDNRFEVAAVESIFRTIEGFSSVRLDEPGGALIEAKYSNREHGDRVLVRLSRGSNAT